MVFDRDKARQEEDEAREDDDTGDEQTYRGTDQMSASERARTLQWPDGGGPPPT